MVILCTLHSNISICSRELFDLAPLNDVDVEMFGGKWQQNWIQNIKKTKELPHDKTKKITVRPAKTHISLGIRPVNESLLCGQWVAKDTVILQADSEDSDQTGQLPRLIWVFAGRTCHFVGFVMRWLKTSWHQAQKLSYTSVWWHYPCTGQSHGTSRWVCKNIRIFHGCEVWIEKSRLCWVMPNSDPEGRIFLSAPNSCDRFFFLHTFWSPAFDLNVGVAINESRSFTLMSAILKWLMSYATSTPNVLTTE